MTRAAALKAWETRRARAGLPAPVVTITAGRRADYSTASTVDLIALLPVEQAILDRHGANPMAGGYTREDANLGIMRSGGSLSAGISRRHIEFAIRRLDAIEQELLNRDVDPGEIIHARFPQLETFDDGVPF